MSTKQGFSLPEDLRKKLDLHIKQHRALSAWDLVKDLPELHTWQGFESRRLAARIALALGNQRLGQYLDWKNWRENPDQDEAYFHALFGRFQFVASSLLLLEMEERLPKLEEGSSTYCDLLGLMASCQGDLREVKLAHQSLDLAISQSPGPDWLLVQRSYLLQKEDRYEEALDSAIEARKISPWYRPSLEGHASALINLNRDDEARKMLIEALAHSDSPTIPLRLSVIDSDLDQVDSTARWLDEYEKRSPLLDHHSQQWLAGRRADLAYLKGDLDTYLDFCKQTRKKSFHHQCYQLFQKSGDREASRKKLDVGFVRQHNMTCAPATMAALTSYFGKTHDHLEIAEAICYDGTPWHKERLWCEEHGFHACEFPVTMESTKALIEADIPFTLTTQAIDSAHLQACIGYDERLDLILLRDPTLRHYGEVILSELQKEHPVMGLRGMAFVPVDDSSKLQDLQLSGQRVYDLYYRLSRAFDDHDEKGIEETMKAYREEFPETPMRWHAEIRVAGRNRHAPAELAAIEELLKLFPDHQPLWLQKVEILERLSRHTEARDFLVQIHRKPESDPFFDLRMGESLCYDIRTLSLGQFYLRRALRHQPSSAQAHAIFADSLVTLGDQEKALRFRHSASRLAQSFEPYARRYYDQARSLHREDEALDFLRERANKTGDLDVSPHLTLLRVLSERNNDEAPQLAEELLERFPKNGELLLEIIQLFSGWNRQAEALRYLEEAESKVTRADYLKASARYWAWNRDRSKSRENWEKLIELQPLNVEAYEAVARHLAEDEDRDEAVRLLRKAHHDHPDYLPLLKSYIEWEEFHGPGISIPLLEKALALDPLDLWTLRELALELSKGGRFEEAEKRAKEALAFDPGDATSHGILGLVYEEAGRASQAGDSFREALSKNIDYLSAFDGLLRVNDTFAGRKKVLEFVREEMLRQVSDGSIVLEYRLQANGVMESGSLEKDLLAFHEERPDLWQTSNALIQHYHGTGQYDLELSTAQSMTEQFPLLPRAWADLGLTLRSQGRTNEEADAFRKAIDLSPSWDWALRELSQSLENLERFDEAIEVLDQSIDADPLAHASYGYKADLLWKIRRKNQAIETIKQALEIAPLYAWGWRKLIMWTQREGRQEEVTGLVSKLTGKRSHQWRWWERLADIYQDLEEDEKSLEAVEEGLKLRPEEINLLDLKAHILADLGRYDEALATSQTTIGETGQPVRLKGREAWIMMQSGRQQEAWDRMKSLSESEPDYYFAHSQLALWAYNTESWPQLKEAAERLIALNPDESDNWSYLGQAEEELKNDEGAIKAYRRALVVDPADLFAARRKAALEIKTEQLGEAEATLKRVQHHHQNAFLSADLFGVELLKAHGDLNDQVRQHWNSISRLSLDLEQDPYYYLEGILSEWGHLTALDLLLSEAAENNQLRSEGEARAWGRRIAQSSKPLKLLKKALQSGLADQTKASMIADFVRAQRAQPPTPAFRKFLNQQDALIKSHFDSWDAVLDFHAEHANGEQVCQLGELWRNFLPETNPPNLGAYASYIDEAQGIDEGLRLRHEILAQAPQWNGTKDIRVCVAFHRALRGDNVEAEKLIAGYRDRHEGQPYYDTVHRLTQALISANQGEAASCETHFRAAANHMHPFPNDKALVQYLERSAEHCALRLGVFKGKKQKLLKNWAGGLGGKKLKINWCYVLIGLWILSRIIKYASR